MAWDEVHPVTGADGSSAEEAIPDTENLARLAAAVQACRGCELYRDATRAVFGSGDRAARVMMVGEQPGDAEDRAGLPFVGPAGRVLDEVLQQAGIDRATIYLTNAVKHFRWKSTDTGRRRLHRNPTARHVAACAPWLKAELRSVRPRVLVALGATAGQALFGRGFRVTEQHGTVLTWPPSTGPYADSDLRPAAVATIHPSAVLRARSAADRTVAFDAMVADLAVVAGLLS